MQSFQLALLGCQMLTVWTLSMTLPRMGPTNIKHLISSESVTLACMHSNQISKITFFWEHENTLYEILNVLESMEATEAVDGMKDWVLQELLRINQLKEVEWSVSRVRAVSMALSWIQVCLLSSRAAFESNWRFVRNPLHQQTPKEYNCPCYICHNIGDVYFISPLMLWHGCPAGRHAKHLDEPSVPPLVGEGSPERSTVASYTVQPWACHPLLCLLPHLLLFISRFSWNNQKEEGVCTVQWVSQLCAKCQWGCFNSFIYPDLLHTLLSLFRCCLWQALIWHHHNY